MPCMLELSEGGDFEISGVTIVLAAAHRRIARLSIAGYDDCNLIEPLEVVRAHAKAVRRRSYAQPHPQSSLADEANLLARRLQTWPRCNQMYLAVACEEFADAIRRALDTDA